MHKDIMQTFSENLATAMTERRMTQAELSRRSGLTEPSINNILRGRWGSRGISLRTADDLADGLGVSLTKLVSRNYTKNAAKRRAASREQRRAELRAELQVLEAEDG
jgi:transcriptional regulator with XRE-family HTH domain